MACLLSSKCPSGHGSFGGMMRRLVFRQGRGMRSGEVPFGSKLSGLIRNANPEKIYSYTPPRLVRFGPLLLSGVFLAYGLSFADWSLSSTMELYSEDEGKALEPDARWWDNPRVRFYGRFAGSAALSVIPLALSAAALYLPSRIVTSITYLPNGACTVARRAVVTGKPVVKHVGLDRITLSKRTRVFTGVGHQGVDDKASFAFFLTDSSSGFWNRFYIVNRSGHIWNRDGRVFDALFGNVPVKTLERWNFAAPETAKEEFNTQTRKQDNALDLVARESQRSRLKGEARSIVLNKSPK
ncbi:LAMI_0A00980g1_1 [Lachancea mirantina]|uniref:LAMI_0A00980g1_1 n=1 Tax=Lachancea mirantina TaxID=1230905 RepID=A0A1G4ILH4_9SACH|nr:LAMI_0A00980g1_1 [Lachancea mirantina]